MATKIRSSDGCWTCRLRRKKCDEEKPACNGCLVLELDCLYSDVKPEWMDGGERQKEMAEKVKAEVKRHASYRRERKYLQGIETTVEGLDLGGDDQGDSMMVDEPVLSRQSAPSSASTGTSSVVNTPSTSAASAVGTGSPFSTSQSAQLLNSGQAWQAVGAYLTAPYFVDPNPTSMTCISNASFEEMELTMAMMYLDYVFPFLFPFYTPPLMDAGRGWLLVLLSRNKALFHAALSLTSYFFAVSLEDSSSDHSNCRTVNAEALERQQQLALKELQRDMATLNQRGFKNSLAETARVMASIVQLLTSEVAVSSASMNWQIHLNAANELFLEIMGNDGIAEHHHPCWTTLLNLMGSGPVIEANCTRPWNSDQASFRFFTATLLLADVVASTALEQAPRLQNWHKHLLAVVDGHDSEPQLQLEEFVGVENWVLIAIGEISALAAWKKDMKKAGSLSITQLVMRAAALEKSIRAQLFRSQKKHQADESAKSINSVLALIQYRPHIAAGPASSLQTPGTLPTALWAQAALTYLNVVVSGWQPACQEIRDSVAHTIDVFGHFPSPAYVRVVAWPFCVTGCLAAPEQEHIFRDIVARLGGIQIFSAVQEALAIMENVWAKRATIEQNPDAWDLAACLRSLGHAPLLI